MEQLTMPLFNRSLSEQERDRVLALVSTNAGEFMSIALGELKSLKGRQLTGEEIREHLLLRGISPHHPNAWGAFVRTAIRKGMLEETGVLSKMRAKSSHARRTMVYLCVG